MKLKCLSLSPSAPCSVPIIQTSSLPLHELALFAGAGGGILGGLLCGFRTVCAVEINEYARNVLLARQDDGCLEPFPVWDDVTTFDGKPWRGLVDIVTGGFPCQDISSAGKGDGIEGERSGLWKAMARIIGEVGPRYVLVENSPVLTSRGLGVVLGDLAALGYDAQWGVLGAHHAGAPHKRDRIWIVANDPEHGRREGRPWRSDPSDAREPQQALQNADIDGLRELQPKGSEQTQRRWTGDRGATDAHPDEINGDDRGHGAGADGGKQQEPPELQGRQQGWWAAEPAVVRMVHGLAHGMDRVGVLGNGQVPAVVRLAWDLLKPKKS